MKQTKKIFAAFLILVMLFTSVIPTVDVWAYSEDTPNEWKTFNITADFQFTPGWGIAPGIANVKYKNDNGEILLEGYSASNELSKPSRAVKEIVPVSKEKVGYKINGNDEVVYNPGECFGIALEVTMNTEVFFSNYTLRVIAYTNESKTESAELAKYEKSFSSNFTESTGIKVDARTYKTVSYNPQISTSPLTAYTNETVENGWIQGVTATQGKTELPLNAENNWGEIKDTTIENDNHIEIPYKMVDGNLVFTGVGIHTHDYTVTDNSDKTTASSRRVITVKTKQAPFLTVRYTDTKEEYKGGWTNRDLDVELSTDIQGEYIKYLYKDNSFFGQADPNEELVKTINTTTRKNGAEFSGMLESSDGNNVKLSPASYKTVFVDKDKPNADIQFNETTGLFTDNSNDVSGSWPSIEEKSGVDKEKTMLAIVKKEARTPADTEYKKLSESAISEAGSYTVYYKVYDRAGNETTGSMDVTLEKEPVKYSVTYNFESATPDKELPTEVTDLLPKDENTYNEGVIVNAKNPEQTEIATEDGVWTFIGWDEESKVANSDVIFIGTWQFKVNEYKVTYEFTSATADRQLPEEVTKLLPTDAETHPHGTTVNAKDLTTTSIKTTDGVWTFQGWDEDSKIATSDLTFTGTWGFKLNEYTVSYQFKSGTENKELPKEVTSLLPTDSKKYQHGSEVTAKQPEKLTVNTIDGVWTFKTWDADKKTASSDVIFIGTWEFKVNEYTVRYEFTSATPGKELPDQVKKLLPTDSATYTHGTNVTAQPITQTRVETNEGVWNFKSWDENSKVATSNLTFTGTWEFKANEYTIQYQFVGGTADRELPEAVMALLPTDSNTYIHGITVNAKNVTETTVKTTDGIWTFKGWDENSKVATSNLPLPAHGNLN